MKSNTTWAYQIKRWWPVWFFFWTFVSLSTFFQGKTHWLIWLLFYLCKKAITFPVFFVLILAMGKFPYQYEPWVCLIITIILYFFGVFLHFLKNNENDDNMLAKSICLSVVTMVFAAAAGVTLYRFLGF